MLVAFDRGELIVDESTHEVRFMMSVKTLTIVAAVMMGFAGASLWSETNHSLIVPFFMIFGWLWLVGGNLLLAMPRFKDFLQKSVDSAPDGR